MRAGSRGCAIEWSTQPTVTSNGVAVSFDDRTFAPLQDFPGWRERPELVRKRFQERGYVLLRGPLDRESVLRLRADYFGRFAGSMFAAGTTPGEGIFSGELPPGMPEYGTAGHPAYEFVRGAAFDAFTRNRTLSDIAAILLGAPVQLLPRRIVRHFHRGDARASRAHVDYDYLDRGSDQLVTAWIPLGDCPIQCGGLVYLENSHLIARERLDRLRQHTDRPADRRPISNDLDMTAHELDRRWLWTDYRAGDVVFHSPHIVHASLDNVSDVMRLSVDLRFARENAARDDRWNGDWAADDGF